jgi:hypothetical protein
MKLNTQLVVLSACETALGKQKIGEGVYSIARGFALTGCPSIVMSFWKVNDKTTSEIMGSFYHNLSQGKKINAALRNSKIDYLEEADEISAHPANWAAFVCLGNVSAVNLPVNNYYKWYYLAGFLFLCITCFFAVKYFMFQARKQVIHHGLESI